MEKIIGIRKENYPYLVTILNNYSLFSVCNRRK